MREEVIRKFGELERLREEVLEAIDDVSEARLVDAPAPGKWSPAQIMYHVAGAEHGALAYIRKKTQTPESVPRAGLKCAVMARLLVIGLASPFKFKAPRVAADVPDTPSLREVVDQWAATRVELREMIQTFPDDLLRRAIFRHPVVGRMNMSQTIDFMIAHLRRHSKQLTRAIG